MLPDQIFHTVGQSNFCGQGFLPEYVIDLLVWRERHSKNVTSFPSIHKVESQRDHWLHLTLAVFFFLPLVLNPTSLFHRVSERLVLAKHRIDLSLFSEPHLFLELAKLFLGLFLGQMRIVALQGTHECLILPGAQFGILSVFLRLERHVFREALFVLDSLDYDRVERGYSMREVFEQSLFLFFILHV